MSRRPTIAVLDGFMMNPGDLSWAAIQELGEVRFYDHSEPGEVLRRCHDVEIAVVNKVGFRGKILRELPNLRLIVVTATGYDQIDVAAASRLGILVCNVPDYSTDSVAEHVFALLLALARRPELHDRQVRAGAWQRANAPCFWSTTQWELAGKTIGIVGWGKIGRRVGQIAAALGMRVVVTSRTPSAEPVPGVAPQWLSLEELFRQSDVVSLHCPLTSESKGLVNQGLLALLPSQAVLINTARGGLIVEADLVEALRTGRLAGAGLDVAVHEPLDPTDPLLSQPACLMTPHLAWATRAARQRLLAATARSITAYLQGNPLHVVSPPSPTAES